MIRLIKRVFRGVFPSQPTTVFKVTEANGLKILEYKDTTITIGQSTEGMSIAFRAPYILYTHIIESK